MALLLVILTVAVAVEALSRPRPTAAGTPTAPGASPVHRPSPSVAAGLPRSAPVRISIPAMKLNTTLRPLGVSADKHTMQLPAKAGEAGWYTSGATPGQPGPTIVVGYIADGHGPGVFSRLGALKAGGEILLRRTDGRLVDYRVDRIASYPRGHFPSAEVYATSSLPTLRLITTGGTLHRGDPPGNVVVYAHQVAVR